MHDLALNHKVVYDFSTLRYACCNAIGQMSTDFAPVFEKKFHARVIPGRLLAVNAFSLSLFLLLIQYYLFHLWFQCFLFLLKKVQLDAYLLL